MNFRKLSHIRGLILDMDGVLWRSHQALVNLVDVFSAINHSGRRVVFATNNSTKTSAQYQEKLRDFGVEVEAWQIITSGDAVAHLLSQHFPEGGNVFTIGEKGLEESLKRHGFIPGETKTPLAVVAGLDRSLTFEKVRQATLFIRSGIPFYGTNPDRTFPVPEGLIPGAGSILAFIESATDVKPIIAGKPFPHMMQTALERLQTPAAETLVVGDRLDTDILGGFNSGCKTALVLSGVAGMPDLKNWAPQPDFIADNLEKLLE